MYSFSYLEPVCCSMSSSNCCFLTCIRVSQEASQVVWYSHLLQNFPQFIVIHTVKGFGVVSKAEVDVFSRTFLLFSMIHWMLAIWSLVPLPFLKPAWPSGSSPWIVKCSLLHRRAQGRVSSSARTPADFCENLIYLKCTAQAHVCKFLKPSLESVKGRYNQVTAMIHNQKGQLVTHCSLH